MPRKKQKHAETNSVPCFVAGIVKGLVEQDDPHAHFGSLLGYCPYARWAHRLQLVTGSPPWFDDIKLTDLGRRAYEAWGLRAFAGRAYMWRQKNFPEPKE